MEVVSEIDEKLLEQFRELDIVEIILQILESGYENIELIENNKIMTCYKCQIPITEKYGTYKICP